LGIYFDTINLTQSLPEEKKNKTIIAINDIRSQKMASTLQIQSITGRLNFISSMCPFLNGFKFNLNKALATAITNGLTPVDNTLLEDTNGLTPVDNTLLEDLQSPTVNWAGLNMIIVSSLVGLEFSGFFLCTAMYLEINLTKFYSPT
jgi:hypothetical protein